MSSERTGAVQQAAMSTEYMNGLYGYAMVLTRNHAQAEDLVQETYVRALPAIGRLRADGNIKAWLFKILRNLWLNQLRKRRTYPELLDAGVDESPVNEIVDPRKDPYATYVSNVTAERVQTAIQQLSAEFRETILLREFEDLSYQEIAVLLECPVGTVMSRLARARRKLRVILSPTLTRPKPYRISQSGFSPIFEITG